MPVARIVTRLPQDAELIAGQLRTGGYTVQIVSPGSPQAGAADIEINLDAYDPQEALRRAGELARAGNDVLVSAGTFVVAEPAVTPAIEVLADVPQQAAMPAKMPVRTVWQAEPEPARSSLVRDVASAAGSAIVAAFQRARHLTFAAVEGAQGIARDAAGSMAVQFARRKQQRQEARRQRALQDVKQRAAAMRGAPAPQRRALEPPQRARLPVIRRTRSRDYELRTAAMFSLALAIGITLAWAAANRRPATPVPASVLMRSNAMQQQVPFGPVTLPAPAVKEHAANMPKLRARALPKPAAAARPQANANDGEVVVRHFTPARSALPSRPAIAVKRVVVND